MVWLSLFLGGGLMVFGGALLVSSIVRRRRMVTPNEVAQVEFELVGAATLCLGFLNFVLGGVALLHGSF